MPRVGALDGLRGLAVLLVLLGHAGVSGWRAAGPSGVAIFFVLSGFLITSLLVTEVGSHGRVDVLGFYVRRAARLLPALGVLLLVTLPLLLLAAHGQVEANRVVLSDRVVLIGAGAALTYTGNFVMAAGLASPYGHTWSLSLEEQFYLLWPFLLPLVIRRPWGWVVLLVGAGVSGMLRLLLWSDETVWVAVFSPLTTVAPLLIGACLAITRPQVPPRAAAAGVVLVAAGALGVWSVGLSTLGACLLVSARPGWLSTPVLRWVGVRSYSIYLWHYPLLFLPPVSLLAWPVRGAAASLIAVAVSAVMWRWVEFPLTTRARAWSTDRSRRRAEEPGTEVSAI